MSAETYASYRAVQIDQLAKKAEEYLIQFQCFNKEIEQSSTVYNEDGRLSPEFNRFEEVIALAFLIDSADALIIEAWNSFPYLMKQLPPKDSYIHQLEEAVQDFLRNLAGKDLPCIYDIQSISLSLD